MAGDMAQVVEFAQQVQGPEFLPKKKKKKKKKKERKKKSSLSKILLLSLIFRCCSGHRKE
jgi:hypothetical protein